MAVRALLGVLAVVLRQRQVRLVAAQGAAAVLTAGPGWRDAGWFWLVLAGLPLLAGIVAVVLVRRGGPKFGVWLAAGVALAWSVLTIGGLGLYFVVPSLLLVAAAVVVSSAPPATPTGAG